MQFLLTALDGTDKNATDRRMRVREEHLRKIKILKNKGEFLFGGAILNDEGKMIGSMIVYDYPDRKSLEESLINEPYFTENVWQEVEIRPFRLASID